MAETQSALALEKLIELQEINSRMAQLEERIDRAPDELRQIEARIETEEQIVSRAQEEIGESKSDRRRLEGEVDSLRAKLSQYKGQLMEVSTNEAYQAMLHEIEFVENQIEKKEDQILEQMVASDELQESLLEAEKTFRTKKSELLAEKEQVETSVAEAREELEGLRERISDVEAEVPPQHLARYEKIAAARNGVAMAMIENHSCTACHVRLRPQLMAEVRANQDIMLCENCNRILYYPRST